MSFLLKSEKDDMLGQWLGQALLEFCWRFQERNGSLELNFVSSLGLYVKCSTPSENFVESALSRPRVYIWVQEWLTISNSNCLRSTAESATSPRDWLTPSHNLKKYVFFPKPRLMERQTENINEEHIICSLKVTLYSPLIRRCSRFRNDVNGKDRGPS